MKSLKKMMALVIAMVMVLAMGMTVFAGGDTGDGGDGGDAPAAATYSITVTNDNEAMSIIGKTYTAYKLFDVTYDGTNYAYSIKTDNPFYSGAAKAAVLDTYFDFTDTSDATVKTVTVKTAKQDATTKTLSADDVRALADALQRKAFLLGPDISEQSARPRKEPRFSVYPIYFLTLQAGIKNIDTKTNAYQEISYIAICCSGHCRLLAGE